MTGSAGPMRADAVGASPTNAWYYNEDLRSSFVKVFDASARIALTADDV